MVARYAPRRTLGSARITGHDDDITHVTKAIKNAASTRTNGFITILTLGGAACGSDRANGRQLDGCTFHFYPVKEGVGSEVRPPLPWPTAAKGFECKMTDLKGATSRVKVMYLYIPLFDAIVSNAWWHVWVVGLGNQVGGQVVEGNYSSSNSDVVLLCTLK
ncbi:hypothetical protein ZHAS_00012806 [Anopheles sinensis]|uniref:Uncharacterized protein n=1 Tax=Anopheles sinensis TaxID=74873 RepID=A0A084W3V1_ANOSI|nr:hypothetical protein ZHAS_00012806 [Anopheles sinensis]